MLNQENTKSIILNSIENENENKFVSEDLSKYSSNNSKNLEYILYVERDFHSAREILGKNFEKFLSSEPLSKKMGNKHKCDRNPYCECVKLGNFLLEIEMNSNSSNSLNRSNSHSNKNLISILENYFYNPGLTLPFELLVHLITSMIKLHDFQSVRSLIENYITYSKIKTPDNIQKTKSSSQSYEITNDQYEELNDILIFKVIMVQAGFSRAKAKINGIKDENLKQKFLEKYYKILYCYTKERERDLMGKFIYDNGKAEEVEEGAQTYNYNNFSHKYDEGLYNKLSNVIDNKVSRAFKFDKIFSKFTVKNSLLQRLVTLVLNKRFLIIAISIVFLTMIKKILQNNKLDERIFNILKILWTSLKQYRLYRAINSFSTGLLKLLINF